MDDGCFYIFVAYEKSVANWWENYLSVSRKHGCDKQATLLYDYNKRNLSARLWQMMSLRVRRFDSQDFFDWFNKVDKPKNLYWSFMLLWFLTETIDLLVCLVHFFLFCVREHQGIERRLDVKLDMMLGIEASTLCLAGKYSKSEYHSRLMLCYAFLVLVWTFSTKLYDPEVGLWIFILFPLSSVFSG